MKKLTALFLAIVMCMSLCIPAFADDITAIDTAELEAVIQAEIEAEKARIFADVYAQLAEQNATGLMDTYIEILTPKIEVNVRTQYGENLVTPMEDDGYRFPNGGTIGYVNSLGATVLDTYMTPNQVEEYISPTLLSEDLLTALEFVIGPAMVGLGVVIGEWGIVYSLLADFTTRSTIAQGKSVIAAGSYANIINVCTASEQGSTMIGWSSHPRVTVPSGVTDLHVAPHN